MVTGRSGRSDGEWIRVPVGADAERFTSRRRLHRVLFVVHNVTSATRLLDLLPLFRDDLRLQLLATCTGSSPYQHGVPELLADLGLPVLPWEQALETPVDLAVSASYGGQLAPFQGKLLILSHGIGYNKRLAAPDAGRRTPDAGRRTPDAGRQDGGHDGGPHRPEDSHLEDRSHTPVFGLAPEWLLHDGRPLAAATVLSHPEQLARLRASCPEAAPTAVLAGDPCYDRLRTAAADRAAYRRALGLGPGQRLVVLNSTWNPESLLGDADGDVLPDLLRRLVEELPCDEYRLAAVLHPNIWHAHGPGQIAAWFDAARRAGALLASPLDTWRQTLVAADLVLGDHGSVSCYAAALGVPVLLGAWPTDGLAPDSPVAAFVRDAPRLDLAHPLRPQFEAAIQRPYDAGKLAAQVSSAPDRSAPLLRRACYRLLGLDEPPTTPHLDRLPVPGYEPAHRTAPLRVRTRAARGADGTPVVDVVRRASAHTAEGPDWAAHTSVDATSADLGRLALADVVVLHAEPADVRHGPVGTLLAELAERHPHAGLLCCVTAADRCTVRTRQGTVHTLRAQPLADGRTNLTDPAAYASALYSWLAQRRSPKELDGELVVRTAGTAHRVRCETTPGP